MNNIDTMSVNAIRVLSADAIQKAKSGHPGLPLGCASVAYELWAKHLKHNPKDPDWKDRDRFILSGGHGSMLLYSLLHLFGYGDLKKEDLMQFRQWGSLTPGHPEYRHTVGVEATTGPLGAGMGMAVGMAIAGKLDNKSYRVYTLLGDGEIQEGQVWEAAESAVKYGLDNFVVLLDHNGLQIDGTNDQVMPVGDPCAKFAAFGFETVKVDGHDIQAIVDAIQAPVTPGKPRFICCETVKGKGVSFMENVVGWHGKAPNKEEYIKAMKELGVEVDG